MEKKSPPLPESKFKFLYFLPKTKSSEPAQSTHTPRLKKNKKKKTAGSASISVKNNGSFRFRGPRSPKVSCIGYVVNKGNKKKRKEEKKGKNDSKGKEHLNAVVASRSNPSPHILNLLKVFKKKGTKLADPYEESSSYSPPGTVHQKSVPKLGNAKKFFELGNAKKFIEWRVHDSSSVAPDWPSSLSNKRSNRAVVVEIENLVLVPRKEINLWKKRMVAPPPVLRV